MSAPIDPDPKLDLNPGASGKTPWYEDLRVIGILLTVVGVLALPLVWFNKKFSVKKKVAITILSVIIAAVLFWIGTQFAALLNRRTDENRGEREAIVRQIGSPKAELGSDRQI